MFFLNQQAVVRPITYMNLTRKSAGVIIFIAWAISALICLPQFVYPGKSISFSVCQTIAPEFWIDHPTVVKGLTAATILFAFYLPLLIVVACYMVVFVKIKQKIDKKVAQKMEQLELLSFTSRPSNQVTNRTNNRN